MGRQKKPSFLNILRTNTFWCLWLSVYLLHLLQQSQLLTDLSIRIFLMPSLRASAGLFLHTCSKSRMPPPQSHHGVQFQGMPPILGHKPVTSLPVGFLSAGSSRELAPVWNSPPPLSYEGWRLNNPGSLPL